MQFRVIITILVLLIIVPQIFFYDSAPHESPEFGLTFSIEKADRLGLDWKPVFLEMLEDLKPKRVRIITESLWADNSSENLMNKYFPYDEILIELEKQKTPAVLVFKDPCFISQDLYSHFKKYEIVKFWEIEGCQNLTNVDFQRADYIGINFSTIKYSQYFGYYKNPFEIANKKIFMGKQRFWKKSDKFVAEIAGSPFDHILGQLKDEQLQIMNSRILLQNIEGARELELGQNYIEGVEWWYYLKQKQNDWGLWHTVRQKLRSG